MENQEKQKRLGSKLIEAGIISKEQLGVALRDQVHNSLRIGEILAKHEFIKQRTADFFAKEWEIIRNVCPKQPVGYYLARAALLNEAQIRHILDEQEKQVDQRFGEIAVQQAWLKTETIRFFLEGLNDDISISNYSKIILKKAILYINEPHIVIMEEDNTIYELHDVEIDFKSEVPRLEIC